MMNIKSIKPAQGPQALGPYSIGMVHGPTLYLSAILPTDSNQEISTEDIKQQTIQVIDNIESLLEAYDLDLSHVLKTQVSVTDIDDYALINQVFAIYFAHPYPARSLVEVQRLPKGAKIQIECTVAFGDSIVEEETDYCESCD